MRKAVIVMVVLIALLVLSIAQAMQINTLKQAVIERQAAADVEDDGSDEYFVGDPNDPGYGYYVDGDNAYVDGDVPAPDAE